MVFLPHPDASRKWAYLEGQVFQELSEHGGTEGKTVLVTHASIILRLAWSGDTGGYAVSVGGIKLKRVHTSGTV